MEICLPARRALRLAVIVWGLASAAPLVRADECAKLYEAIEKARAPAGNPFFSATAEGLSQGDRQWYALDALVNDHGLPEELRREAAAKLSWFTRPAGTGNWNAVWQALSPADRAQSAAEFALTAFTDPGTDGGLRAQLLYQLGASPRSDARTIEGLLPIASGARITNNAELRQAADAIQSIAGRTGSYPARFVAAVPRTDALDVLEHEPVESVKKLGGGLNETLLVKFKNGKKAVFKPRSGEVAFSSNDPQWVDFPREASFSPLVEEFLGNAASAESPVAVTKAVPAVLVHDGKNYGLGSLQNFADGYFNIEEISGNPRYAKVWETIMKQPQWTALTSRIRAIDYIAGNYDRLPLNINYRINPKNFLIRLDDVDFTDPAKAEAQLRHANWDHLHAVLIDNGLGRNSVDAGKFDINGFGHFPLRQDVPPDLREAILHFDEARFREAMKDRLPAFGIDDVIRRVRDAQNRLRTGP